MKFSTCTAVLILMPLASLHGEVHDVRVINHEFVPDEVTIQVGDRVRWTNEQGRHNLRALDGSFRCANFCDHQDGGNGTPSDLPWIFSLTFDEPGVIEYVCENHYSIYGMGGKITVVGEPQQEPSMAPNFGHTGSWYNPATEGQGFNIEVVVREDEPAQVVLYWFTFSEAGSLGPAGKDHVVDGHRWFIAVGELPAADNVVPMDVFISSDGVFDGAEPAPVQDSSGTATLTFASCTEGKLTYDVTLHNADAQQVSGEIPIQRLTPDVECENLAAR